ncbi:hypothetical protein DSECCO2_268170 [anaerobic digester metagenome]
MRYLEWNKLLAAHYFNPEMAGREVILFADKDLVDRLGAQHHVGFEDFLHAVKLGPESADRRYRGDVFQLALQTYSTGRGYNFEYPPYIAYLVLFVCAATISGGYNPNAYYPRLLDLIGEDRDRNIAGYFRRVDRLWKDLEVWSKKVKNESLGRFTKRQRGGYVHVGIILSQTVLSEGERQYLPSIFSAARLDPTDPPSQDVLRGKLRQYGPSFLTKRTLDLLDSRRAEDQDLLGSLIDLVMTELEAWDGKVVEEMGAQAQQKRVSPYARICLSPGLGGYASSLRFKVNPDNVVFPEGGLEFTLRDAPGLRDNRLRSAVFSCHQTNRAGWSTPISTSVGSLEQPLQADTFDWTRGATFEDKDKGWRLTLRPERVRVFLPGSGPRLPDAWVEVQRLEYEYPFLVACHDSVRSQVASWGETGAERFTEIQSQGLPPGWGLFRGENAVTSSKDFDSLRLPTDVRLRLVGGVRVGAGNYYLSFARPTVVVEGAQGDVAVTINGERSEPQAGTGLRWALPEGLSVGEPITIEARSGDEKLQNSRTIRLVEPEMVTDFSKVPKRDRFGDITGDTGEGLPEVYVQGAVVYGVGPSEYDNVPIGAPTYISHSITFIGPRPGQVARWPEEPLPTDWEPVWALAKSGKDKWDVHFCGRPGDLKAPTRPPVAEKKKRKSWREAVWVNRKRNRPPRIPGLRVLWSRYVEVARDV